MTGTKHDAGDGMTGTERSAVAGHQGRWFRHGGAERSEVTA